MPAASPHGLRARGNEAFGLARAAQGELECMAQLSAHEGLPS